MATHPQRDIRYDAPEPPLQLEKVFNFQQRLFFDMSATLGALAAFVGDRLGFFRSLAEQGRVSAREFARSQEMCPEMVAEWLRVMTCAGYLEYDSEADLYGLHPSTR